MASNHVGLGVIAWVLSLLQIILLAAIFGFFYAYACSVMWGLDLAGGVAAIEAMNGINTVVRNAAFAPAFFGPIPVGLATIVVLWIAKLRLPTIWFSAAWLVYIFGGFLITAMGSVPMNRDLLATDIPSDLQLANDLWNTYSADWQRLNWARTFCSGLAFVLAVLGFFSLGNINSGRLQTSNHRILPRA